MKPGFDLSTTADAELIGAYLEGSLPDDQMLAVEDLIDDSPQHSLPTSAPSLSSATIPTLTCRKQ